MLETILTMSLYGSLVGLAALALSLALNHIRAPKGAALILWALAALRLLCPLDISSDLSIWRAAPQVETARLDSSYAGSYHAAVQGTPEFDLALAAGAPVQTVATQSTAYYYQTPTGGIAPAKTLRQTLTPILTAVWAVGAGLFLLWGVVSYVLFRRKLRFSMRLSDEIYEVDTIPSPCVAGFLRPRVYLPVGLTERQRQHTIAHERSHIRNRDHIWKLISYLVLSVHWFNPLVWLQYRRFQQDLEMACDERVLKALGTDARADYSQSLLELAKKQHAIVPSPIAFSENTTKERITKILRYKKPLTTVTALALIVSIILAGCLATSPTGTKSPAQSIPETTTEPTESSQATEPQNLDEAQYQQPLPEDFISHAFTSIFDAENDIDISMYVAGTEATPAPGDMARYGYGREYVEQLAAYLNNFTWKPMDTPPQELPDSWIRFSAPDGTSSLTCYDGGEADIVCIQAGAAEAYWILEPDPDYLSFWHRVRSDYDYMEIMSTQSSIAFSAPDAQSAAEYFANTAYGEALCSLTPGGSYSITDYKLVSLSNAMDISQDGSAVVLGMEFAVIPEDWNSGGIWAGNTRAGEGEYEGWAVMSRQACLQLQDDGLWHCIDVGTGGVGLPE